MREMKEGKGRGRRGGLEREGLGIVSVVEKAVIVPVNRQRLAAEPMGEKGMRSNR